MAESERFALTGRLLRGFNVSGNRESVLNASIERAMESEMGMLSF